MATLHGKCSVKIEKALNLWVEDLDRKQVPTEMCIYEDFNKGSPETSDHIHITFIMVHYNCIILLFAVFHTYCN